MYENSGRRYYRPQRQSNGVISDYGTNSVSQRDLGKALDSTVDFVLIYSLFIAFYSAGRLATYQFTILYIAMLTILSVQLLTQGDGAIASPATGKLVGALEYVFLLFLTAREVLPETSLLASLGLALFLILAGAIALNTIVCLNMIIAAMRPPPGAGSSGGRSAA